MKLDDERGKTDEGSTRPVHGPAEVGLTGAGSVSVVIPVLNESRTIGNLVALLRRNDRVREVLVVDDGSIDGTAKIAAQAGARVMTSSFLGKGASMRDGIDATEGEFLLFLDGDLLEIGEDFVERMTGPLLSGKAELVKAKFSRDAGRVTVLTARPLLSAFFPELAPFDQPLGGIVAARRSLLGGIRLEKDYGVDIGLFIDAVVRGARVVEVDIGRIDHDSKPLEALSQMANQVTRVILDRAWKNERLGINQILEMRETERRASASLLPFDQASPQGGKFALFDMDGVLLDGRYVVELAERAGLRPELSLLLDSQMMPDIDRTRSIASLFTGVHWDVFEETAQEMPLMEGAVETVLALREAGYRVGIVTDSFHVAAQTVRQRVFADFCVAHVMHFRNRLATGQITLSPLMTHEGGCTKHNCCKLNVLGRLKEVAGLRPEDTIAVGDGETDTCMLQEAGLSIAFRPRSHLVEEAATYTVRRSLVDILRLLPSPGPPQGLDGLLKPSPDAIERAFMPLDDPFDG